MMRLNKPAFSSETIRAMEDMSFFTHSLIFDGLLIVAQRETNCFVLKTNDGLIIIDAIWPSKKAFDSIVAAIKDVGWNSDTIKKLLLTHGHVDHTGCGKWFVEQYHVDVALINHTAIDNGLERIAYSRKRLAYIPNIYIIGPDGFQKYCQVFRTMSLEKL